MTIAASNLGVAQLLIVQLAAFLAALLLASGLHKLIGRERIQAAVQEFAGVPRRFAPFVVAAVAATEGLAGILLWMPSSRAAGGALAVLIWGCYLWLILRAIAHGRRDVDCGCSFGAAQRPLGTYHVVRTAGLSGGALLVAAGCAASVTGPIIASQILAALALLALYGALDQAMSLTPPRNGALL
ncbi:MAG TPA: MauE/DoxX family redox-associated membrane protein [Steroidobacteraceae bacterium]